MRLSRSLGCWEVECGCQQIGWGSGLHRRKGRGWLGLGGAQWALREAGIAAGSSVSTAVVGLGACGPERGPEDRTWVLHEEPGAGRAPRESEPEGKQLCLSLRPRAGRVAGQARGGAP